MSVFHNNALIGGSNQNYQIERSLRFNSADSAYLGATLTTPTDNKKWTYSCWLKRTGFLATSLDFALLTSASNAGALGISGTGAFGAALNGKFFHASASGTYYYVNVEFRDPSSWYHFVFVADTANATGDDRQILYVNGVRQPNFSATIAQNTALALNSARAHFIGGYAGGGATPAAGYYTNGYLAEVNFIDGQALTPSSFGETDTITGVWKPKKYAGTYGTNGFYLKFADNSGTTSTTLGKDSSPNGNNFTPNNFSVTAGAGNDSMIDTPTPYADGGNGRGNYCTLNPLAYDSSTYTLSNGSLEFSGARTASGTWYIRSTQSIATGKWYWEVTPTNVGGGPNLMVGIQDTTTSAVTGSTNTALNGYGYGADGAKYNNAGYTNGYGATYAANDVVGVAFDADAGTIVFYKNGTSQGTAFSSITGTFSPTVMMSTAGVARTVAGSINFGQRAFAYTPPSGFLALNTQNLPEPTVKKPSSYMNTLLYTGNGGTQTITGLSFQSDFIWIKERSANVGGTGSHRLYDSQRGPFGYWLSSNSTAAETASGTLGLVDSTGFTLGTDNDINDSGASYVAWCWDESATPGFDIVTYTGNGVSGRAVSHNLGVAPKMVIVKSRTGAYDWSVWHTGIGTTQYMSLNKTNAAATLSTVFNGSFTSTEFTVGTFVGVNENGANLVAYLWSEVAGFSKFGSYTGNGVADGPFVYCGFRPRWVMIKRSDSTSGWHIYDTARSTYNVNTLPLAANLADQESSFTSGFDLDVLSNGFKARAATSIAINTSGGTYIFAAFAESPFKYSLAR